MDAKEFIGSGTSFLNAKVVKDEGIEGKMLTIENVQKREFDDKQKLTLSFNEIEQDLALNQTNITILCDAFGQETDRWNGRAISLTLVKTRFQGQQVDSIQVKTKQE
jgi:hypothetical protein